jgi:hypothetical protein
MTTRASASRLLSATPLLSIRRTSGLVLTSKPEIEVRHQGTGTDRHS